MSVLSLQGSTVYGPVRSRRLGFSLGVNLLPRTRKFCSYNCVYCQYGWTKRHGLGIEDPSELPSVEEVRQAVESALRKGARLDYITLAGNGEPTLHPGFGEVVDVVRELRDRHAPRVRTAVLSNSSTVHRPEVREALGRLDEPIMKLDAGTESTWKRYNSPCPGIEWRGMIDGLAALARPTIQALFAGGEKGNDEDDEIGAWVELLTRIRPRHVQVYSVDRPSADGGMVPVPGARLEDIAGRARHGAGVSVSVY
jgi:wyosine [tRNA(Phe)-imidazoG37] synthetase (radical SAM superfamily)